MHGADLFVDHVFMLVDASEVDTVAQSLLSFGLIESSRRVHTGLGTANIFFCFDNIFLEILWVVDRQEAAATELGGLLLERLDARTTGSMPFGIGFRTGADGGLVPFATRILQPPPALAFKPIEVAQSSLDCRQPLLFRAQRAARPDAWTDGKAGLRQRPGGIAEVVALCVTLPVLVEPTADLKLLEHLGVLKVKQLSAGPGMVLSLSQLTAQGPLELALQSPLALKDRP